MRGFNFAIAEFATVAFMLNLLWISFSRCLNFAISARSRILQKLDHGNNFTVYSIHIKLDAEIHTSVWNTSVIFLRKVIPQGPWPLTLSLPLSTAVDSAFMHSECQCRLASTSKHAVPSAVVDFRRQADLTQFVPLFSNIGDV